MLHPKNISARTLEVSGGHWRPNKLRALCSHQSALCTVLCKTLHHLISGLFFILGFCPVKISDEIFSLILICLSLLKTPKISFHLLSVFQMTLAKNMSHYVSLAILDTCLYE
jgi:thiamine transporter ThiT